MSLLFLQTPPPSLKNYNNHSATGLETLPDPPHPFKKYSAGTHLSLWLIIEPPLGG